MMMPAFSPAISVRVQRQDFDLAAEVAAMSEGRGDIGAIVTFSGLCRDEAGTLLEPIEELTTETVRATLERMRR